MSRTEPGGEYRESRLSNGLRVLSERMEGVRSVAVGVWVRQGSAHEPPGLAGMSHLLEHMVFRGTTNRSRRQIAVALEGLGGSLNAYTSREHTGYEARVRDHHLALAVEVLSDLVRNPLLRQEDLDREKEIVFEEIAAVEDTPEDLVFDLHGSRMWKGHPYGRPILGTRETVAAVTAADLSELRSRTHTAANLVVAAAGRVDHGALVALAEEWFGGLEPGEPVSPAGVPRTPGRGIDLVRRDSLQSHLVFGSPTPGASHSDRYALLLLSAALGGGLSSRLFQRVREELALAYSVYSFHSLYLKSGVFGVYLGTRSGWVADAIDAVRTVCGAVARDGLSHRELARTKEQAKGEIVLSLESPEARVNRLAGFALLDLPFVPMDRLPGLIDGVDRCDIARVAAEVLPPERQFALCLGPGDAKSDANGRAACGRPGEPTTIGI